MSDIASPKSAPDQAAEMRNLAADTDTGARHPIGLQGATISALAIAWSLFQIFTASAMPFWLYEVTGINFVFNGQQQRIVHLAFALALAALAYPLLRSSPRNRIPWYDWVLAAAGAVCCLYLLVFDAAISARSGLPTTTDLIISTIGLLLVALSVLRTLGLPMLIVAGVFAAYVFFGDAKWLPDVIRWKGASYGKAMWHFWMQTEGVFGVALGVSASMIFLFVLFGALLERAGAGNYFIKLAFALLGHLRGGPAKAAVVSSALSGIYSGSSIANVVTTGTFTIPLMKRTGFSAEKAGAVEVAASTNGQLTPPVMGAAAFLIAEFTGISYSEIIKHALLPALISYIALLYIVHLEALKLNLAGLPRPPARGTIASRLAGFIGGFLAAAVFGYGLYLLLGAVAANLPSLSLLVASSVFAALYLACIAVAARRPDLELDDPDAPLTELPHPGDVLPTGLHFLLPIAVMLWCILVDNLSPALSAFWAVTAMLVIVVTQHPLKSAMRGRTPNAQDWRLSWDDLIFGLIGGARAMVPIAVATAIAGIIIGTVSLTGVHQVVGEFVEFLSGGSLMLMLALVAVMSLVLGMGLPTTANYIVVSSLMAPVIVSVGAQQGLIVPLIAVHMFVFYFGILADDTPPVGLAAFAAAGISGGDPIRTGLQGFAYDIRTALLPFLFIFNTELLLIDVTWTRSIFVFAVAVVAMLLFAAATQGYWQIRSRLWESLALLAVSLTLFRPGFWLDMVQPPYVDRPGTELTALAGKAPAGSALRVVISGPDFDDANKTINLTALVPIEAKHGRPLPKDGDARLKEAGLTVVTKDGKAVVDEPMAGTAFFKRMQAFDFYADTPVQIARVEVAAERWPKEIFYIPAIALLAFVYFMQSRRRRKEAVPEGA